MASGNTVSQSGVTRWDSGAASGNAMNMSANQRDWQTLYDDPAARAGGYANDNRNIGTMSTMGGNAPGYSDLMNYLTQQSGSGVKASDTLARDKFNYDKKQDAASAAQAAKVLASQQGYYDSGAANKGFDALLKMIGDQGTVSENAVKGAYGNAITNLNQGYDAAQALGNSGYGALNTYLAANQNNPYAGMQATVGSAPDALTQYLSAYGVSDQPVQGQIQADQLQAQQGAGNYQNLINILSSVAQSGASSRGAESAMGENLFNTTLGQERAGYQTRAEMAQADAMRQIQEQMYQQRLANESSRNAQMQQLAQALAAAGGQTGSGGVAPVVPATVASTQTETLPALGDGRTAQQIQYENLIRNAPGQNTDDLLRELNARRGY